MNEVQLEFSSYRPQQTKGFRIGLTYSIFSLAYDVQYKMYKLQ